MKAARNARLESPGSSQAGKLSSGARAKVAEAKKSLEAARQALSESSVEESDSLDPESGTSALDDIRRKIDEAAASGDSEAVEHYEELLQQFRNATERADSDASAVGATERSTEAKSSGADNIGGMTGLEGSGQETSPGDGESKYRIMYANMLRGQNSTTEEVEATIAEIEGSAEKGEREELFGATGVENTTIENSNGTRSGNGTVAEHEVSGDDDVSQVAQRRDFARLHRMETQNKYEDFLGKNADNIVDDATGSSGSGDQAATSIADPGASARFKDSPYADIVDASER